jgi:cysteine desulfurase/selenocysteine lyase
MKSTKRARFTGSLFWLFRRIDPMRSDYKSVFPRASEVTYLDTAAEGLPFQACREALIAYFEDKAMGSPGRSKLHAEERAALNGVARLLGVQAADVALVSSASDALNIFANSIDWRAGDEVLVCDLEFPSGVLAWLRLRERGVTVRVLASQQGLVSLDRFAAAIGPATRIVCVSHVSYCTGARLPFLSELSALAHARGALLVVDATQSLGRLPVPVEGVDFLVASTYKWLLGVHGLAVAYLAPYARERISEGTAGWYSVPDIFSADRFERYKAKPGAGWMMTGMPAFPAIYALRRSVDFLLEANIAKIEEDLKPVVLALHLGLRQLGLDLLTPQGGEYASGIVSFRHPACERIGAALQREGAIVWSGDGRVRASVHLYNDMEDVNRLLQILPAAIEQEAACRTRS